jgi:hypothetical protein
MLTYKNQRDTKGIRMFEKCHEPLAPLSIFIKRLFFGIALALLVVVGGLSIGMIGYHSLEPITWLDAFYNSALILSDMGPISQIETPGGKLFIGIYALFSGLAFVTIISIAFTPIIHRLIHSFCLKPENMEKTL